MTHPTPPLAQLVRSVVDAHRHLRAPLLVVLQAIQDRAGYIDEEVIPLLATELNLSRADVHGVVTFYRDFRREPLAGPPFGCAAPRPANRWVPSSWWPPLNARSG